MPRIIDHDERRREIAAIVEDLVYEGGVEALTIRDVAARAGCSTTIVSHYFRSKLDMLLFTHQTVRLRAESLLEQAIARRSSLFKALSALLPMSEPRKKDWNTWFAFWGMAPADPRVTAEWHQGSSRAHILFEQLIRAAQARAEVDAGIDAAAAANMVQAMINGIASLWVQDRAAFNRTKQAELLRQMLGGAGLLRNPLPE